MKTLRARRASLVTGSLIAVIVGFGAACSHTRNGAMAHQHCMKVTGTMFNLYASEHGGALPYHTNGFGDALVLLAEGRPQDVAFLCGPGDDGRVLSNAVVQGLHVAEEQCSRVYVQGLCKTNDPQICILFDRRSVRGGDHFYGTGKRVREVCLLDGSMQRVPDAKWPEFSREQVDLLVAAGFRKEEALRYYPEALARR